MILDESNDSYTEHAAPKSSNPVKKDFLKPEMCLLFVLIIHCNENIIICLACKEIDLKTDELKIR